MAAWIKVPLGTEAGLGQDDILLDWDSAVPYPNGGRASPHFWPMSMWPSGGMDQDGTWHRGVPWSRPHIVLDGDRAPYPKRGQSPQFSAHFYSAPQCSHCMRCTSYGISVCLSVRLSHAGTIFDGT